MPDERDDITREEFRWHLFSNLIQYYNDKHPPLELMNFAKEIEVWLRPNGWPEDKQPGSAH